MLPLLIKITNQINLDVPLVRGIPACDKIAGPCLVISENTINCRFGYLTYLLSFFSLHPFDQSHQLGGTGETKMVRKACLTEIEGTVYALPNTHWEKEQNTDHKILASVDNLIFCSVNNII